MNNELLVIGSPVVGRIIWVTNHRNQITTFWTPWTLLIKHKLSKRFKQEQKEHKFSRNVSGISHKEWSEMQNEMETIQQKILKCETEFRGIAKMWNAAILGRLNNKKKSFTWKDIEDFGDNPAVLFVRNISKLRNRDKLTCYIAIRLVKVNH